MLNHLRAAIVIFVSLTLVTGVAYPLLVTGIGQALFPARRKAASSRPTASCMARN